MNKVIKVGRLSVGNKIRRVLWLVSSFFLFKPFVTNFFSGWRRFILCLFGAKIDRGANVYSSVNIWAPWNLQMKSGSCLGPNVICYNQAPITVETNAIVSQYSYLCTASHDVSELNSAESGLIIAPITIGKNAWIGTRTFIGMGVTIGEGAIVGATASVYKDVEPWTIVGGNPAKFLKKRVLDK